MASSTPMPCTAKHSGPRAILGSPCFNIRYLFPGLTQGNMPWVIERKPKLEPQSDTKRASFQLGMRPCLRCLHNSSHTACCSRGNNIPLVAIRNSSYPVATSSGERPCSAWKLGWRISFQVALRLFGLHANLLPKVEGARANMVSKGSCPAHSAVRAISIPTFRLWRADSCALGPNPPCNLMKSPHTRGRL